MCGGNCNCKNKTEIIEVEKPWGLQLKFAVPPEGENVETVNVVDEIRDDVLSYITNLHKTLSDKKSGDPIDDGYISHRISTLSDVEYDIKKIFEKYSK